LVELDGLPDRLHRERYRKPWGGDLNGNAPHTTYYQYNGTGRVAGVFTHDTNTNVKREMFSGSGNYDGFDRFGRPVRFAWQDRTNGAVLDQVDYTYDYAGNRLTRNVRVDLINGTYPDTRDQKYTYDGLQRLLTYDQGTLSAGAITSSNTQRYWELDQLGNWPKLRQGLTGTSTVLEERTHNAVNELAAFITPTTYVDPVHDAAGNMTTIPQPATPTSSFALQYDAWNRLTVAAENQDEYYYEYDGLGQRIRKNLVGSGGDVYDYYYNDQWQLLTEVRSSGVASIYQWNPFYIDALAVRMTASKTHFFMQDANFNVTAAVDDNGNAVVERYAYSPYGDVTILEDDFPADADGVSDIGNQHLYTGRERDPETGLQLNRHRYYDALLGRWITRDPIGYISATWNLYEFVGSSPTAWVDFMGTSRAKSCVEEFADLVLGCMLLESQCRKKAKDWKDRLGCSILRARCEAAAALWYAGCKAKEFPQYCIRNPIVSSL
jgi:RHS repeat-associated protein